MLPQVFHDIAVRAPISDSKLALNQRKESSSGVLPRANETWDLFDISVA